MLYYGELPCFRIPLWRISPAYYIIILSNLGIVNDFCESGGVFSSKMPSLTGENEMAAEIRRRLYYLSEISDTVMYALQLRAVIFYEIVIENYSSFKRFYAEVFVYCVCAVKLCTRHHKRNESQYAIAYLRIVT